MIESFDLGNSPFEYSLTAVRGRTLVYASTNGSLAILAAAPARRRLLAAFVNAAAAVDRLQGERDVVIVCAGNLRGFALEDAALRRAPVRAIAPARCPTRGPSRAARAHPGPCDALQVRALVQGCSHGRYLRNLSEASARDVEFCAGLDTLDRAFEV